MNLLPKNISSAYPCLHHRAAHAAHAAQCLSDKSDVGPIHPSFFVTFGKKHDAGSSSEVHES
jgi:hypothetical protein